MNKANIIMLALTSLGIMFLGIALFLPKSEIQYIHIGDNQYDIKYRGRTYRLLKEQTDYDTIQSWRKVNAKHSGGW